MSDSKIHILSEEERKSLRESKKYNIISGKDSLPKPPYSLVNGALELNPEILLDEKKEKVDMQEVQEKTIDSEEKVNEELVAEIDDVSVEKSEGDELFNYEVDYNDEDDNTAGEIQLKEQVEETKTDEIGKQQVEDIVLDNKGEEFANEIPEMNHLKDLIKSVVLSNDFSSQDEKTNVESIKTEDISIQNPELDNIPDVAIIPENPVADTINTEESITIPEVLPEPKIQELEQTKVDIVASEIPEVVAMVTPESDIQAEVTQEPESKTIENIKQDSTNLETPDIVSIESQESDIQTEITQEPVTQVYEQIQEEVTVSETKEIATISSPENIPEQIIEQENNINDEELTIPEDIQQYLVQEESEFVEQKLPVEEYEESYESNFEENTSDTIQENISENEDNLSVTPIPKTRKISVIVSPKTLDNLINTKQFKEELEEIFRKIVNNLDFEADEKHRLVRTKKVKELENVKSILMRVLSNQSITLDDKDQVEAFLEDVLNNDSFYRKEIIKALDSIELVYPLKLLGFSEKVSLIKDIIEGKEINSLIGTILGRIENLIVYKRFERKRIQKYYIEDEEGTKINKIITDFFNGRFTSITEIAYNIRNEIGNIFEQKELFSKIAEKLTKFEPKYRKSLENTVIDNQYTVESVFDVMVSYVYNLDTKIIYVESFNQKMIK